MISPFGVARERTPVITGSSRSKVLYAINLTLLSTHQVDAAFQREWEMFGVPGGIQFFLVFNWLAVFLLMLGFIRVATNAPHANLAVYGLAGVGTFTFGVHMIFILLGHPEFREPWSLGILTATLLVSALQVLTCLQVNRRPYP